MAACSGQPRNSVPAGKARNDGRDKQWKRPKAHTSLSRRAHGDPVRVVTVNPCKGRAFKSAILLRAPPSPRSRRGPLLSRGACGTRAEIKTIRQFRHDPKSGTGGGCRLSLPSAPFQDEPRDFSRILVFVIPVDSRVVCLGCVLPKRLCKGYPIIRSANIRSYTYRVSRQLRSWARATPPDGGRKHPRTKAARGRAPRSLAGY